MLVADSWLVPATGERPEDDSHLLQVAQVQEARDLQDHAVQGWQGLGCRAGCAAAILWNHCYCCACQLAASRGGVLQLWWLSLVQRWPIAFCVPAERRSGTLSSSSSSVSRSLTLRPACQSPSRRGPATAQPVQRPLVWHRRCRCSLASSTALWLRPSVSAASARAVHSSTPESCRAVPCCSPETTAAVLPPTPTPLPDSYQVSGGTTGSRRASAARPSLSSTRRWALAPSGFCSCPDGS